MKEAMLQKLQEVNDMLTQAQCDGQAIEEGDNVHKELTAMLQQLTDAVDYYVD